MSDLRSHVIRLASEHPEFRKDLLPLLKTATEPSFMEESETWLPACLKEIFNTLGRPNVKPFRFGDEFGEGSWSASASWDDEVTVNLSVNGRGTLTAIFQDSAEAEDYSPPHRLGTFRADAWVGTDPHRIATQIARKLKVQLSNFRDMSDIG